jgi:DNA-binding transcriptional regulator PaaX
MLSSTKQKILLLLLAGVALGLSYSPRRQQRILKEFGEEWEKIDEKKIKDEIRQLYQSKLIERKQNADGSTTLTLTDKGKLRALTFHFQDMRVSDKDWDGKWRIVVFDVPEKLRFGRNALRAKLKALGFYELQKSVLVFPYECEQEIEFIVEFFNMRRFVRFCRVEYIDNEVHLRKVFRL